MLGCVIGVNFLPRRSSTESARRLSSESKESLEEKAIVEKCDKPRARISPPLRKAPFREEPGPDKPPAAARQEPEKPAEDVKTAPLISTIKAKAGEDKEVRQGRKLFQATVDRPGVQKTHDVFDFKVEEEPLEPLKAIERPKTSTCSVDSVIEEVVKNSYEETTVPPPAAGRVTLPRKPLTTAAQPSSGIPAPLVVSPSSGPSASLAVQPSSGPSAGLAVQPSPGLTASTVAQPSPVLSASIALQPTSGLSARLASQPSSVLPVKTVLQPSSGLPASLALQPIHVATSLASPPPAQTTMSPAVSHDSPLSLQRLSVEEKASPPLPLLSSPNSAKSPRPPRTRRSTGGKSRESEEESPDTLQKINLILEQAKQEAERSAHNQHQGLQGYSQAPPHSQDILIDPKTGQVVARQAAPNSVTLTLVSSSPQELHQHPADLRVAVPRTGVPQPTVLPPRHEQPVRPGQVVARQVAAPARHAARPALPIQLPTQPLPPESVRKAQPVLLEQNQPSKLARAPLPVSLPTEPVPRSVAAASQLPSLPRTPLPFSSSGLVISTGATALRLVTSQPIMSRAQVTPSWQPGAQARPQQPSQETGQRVSLNKRDKEPELEAKVGLSSEPVVAAAMKVGRDYLQPREREVLRPASTPLSTCQPQQYEVAAQPHLTSTAAQYEADLLRLANYRDLTLIYNQLLTQGHPEHVAQNLAQSMVRERYESYRPVHEEPRPGSVPPGMAMHHIEEIRRQQQQQIVQRQPLPAHSPQVDPYRQADSPHGALYLGAHPYSTPHASHLDSYRRPGLGPEPPAAHSGQPVARMTQSPAVSDYSISRPSSPTYNTMSDYRLPHLAAYPICWSGTLGLKNDTANVRMHYVSGNRDLAKASLPDTGSSLKINQRMRLEDSQLDGVARKMETKSEHCMLLALPNGSEHEEIEHQSKILRSNFITYLQLKSAAGIVNVSNEDNQPAYIVHVFPSCDFANENLAR